MQKLYLGLKTCLLLIVLLILPSILLAQEIKLFTAKDFELEGRVKSCLVLTDYGREEFEFNTEGYLTKSVTRYNDKDYNITYYKYKNGNLLERRDEVYRDGEFDQHSSLAHFFTLDTVAGKKITEQIVTYDKEFVDRYEYFFEDGDKPNRIIRSSNEGVDETSVEHTEYKGETTTTFFLNEVLLKTIRESVKKSKDGGEQRLLLTKEFINGSPDKAVEQLFDTSGNLIKEIHFKYSMTEKSFVPVKEVAYSYDSTGQLSSISTRANGQTETKSYIFQFDAKGNWIKKVITPDNAYTTRRIEYYPEESADKNGD